MTNVSQQAAIRFCNHTLWADGVWMGTTYRCDPTGESPPVIGLIFADWEKCVELFSSWTDDWGHEDPDDSIRIAIIEGDLPGQPSGYAMRIAAGKLELEPGQTQRMYPTPETETMFSQFKSQYLQHGEFLLCPVVVRDDTELCFNAFAGIVKHHIEFLNFEDISAEDLRAIESAPTINGDLP